MLPSLGPDRRRDLHASANAINLRIGGEICKLWPLRSIPTRGQIGKPEKCPCDIYIEDGRKIDETAWHSQHTRFK